MRKYLSTDIITTGLAAFSMFFGAGNVVFPLIIGKLAGSHAALALIGFLITAVGLPFLGLVAMSYFNGDYEAFFFRIGKVPGSILIFIIMGLIGPFAAMPRLVTVSYAALKMYLPDISLMMFSIICALIIFGFTIKKSRILEALGNILSPILLLCLGIIIFRGLGSAASPAPLDPGSHFFEGFLFGYNTMDLFASIFFSTVILSLLKIKLKEKGIESSSRALTIKVLQAGAIAASLLAIVYIGLGLVAAARASILATTPSDELLSVIANQLLGPIGGIVASTAVAMACLTTAISLACVFADFLNEEVLRGKMHYGVSLVVTLGITTLFANLGFEGIMNMLIPILSIIYPAVIVLTICNIAYKVWGVKIVKLPVFITLGITAIIQLWPLCLQLLGTK